MPAGIPIGASGILNCSAFSICFSIESHTFEILRHLPAVVLPQLLFDTVQIFADKIEHALTRGEPAAETGSPFRVGSAAEEFLKNRAGIRLGRSGSVSEAQEMLY